PAGVYPGGNRTGGGRTGAMARKLFGTDGIRGTANSEPMTPETALKVAMAVGESLHNGTHKHLVVIGKDTRLSGYMLEPALTAGFITMGMDVVLVGPLPTPAIAMLTRSLRADIGVVISASHNPFGDNGIKLFGPDGYKLSDDFEARIEAAMSKGPTRRAAPSDLGRAKRLDDAGGRYIEFVKQSFPKGLRLDGLRVVVDCAHGAAYKVAPTVFWELGAEVFPIAVLRSRGSGSTAPRSATAMSSRRCAASAAISAANSPATSSSVITRQLAMGSLRHCRSWRRSSRPASMRAKSAASSSRFRSFCAMCVSVMEDRSKRRGSSGRLPPPRRGSAKRAGSSSAIPGPSPSSASWRRAKTKAC